MCFPFSPEKWETHKQFDPHPFPGQSREVVYVYWFFSPPKLKRFLGWAAANGGVTNGGLRGVWPPFLEIGRNRPKSPFFCLFRPFPEGAKSTWEIQKTEEKGLFPQISSDFLKPPSLKPPFAALQLNIGRKKSVRRVLVPFPPPRDSAEPSHGRKPAERPSHRTTKVLQNFGSQAQLFRPC